MKELLTYCDEKNDIHIYCTIWKEKKNQIIDPKIQ